ncbi:MAG: hypothetical protein U5K79_23515 [Cyclobacteriaceae bacterium]|nr:hypothetical protein [Cyclobacteriaceae bacterium]
MNQKNTHGDISATLPYAVVTGFDILKAIKSDTFSIDELYIENPDLSIQQTQAATPKGHFSPSDLFGVYKKVRIISSLFHVEDLHIKNGRISIRANYPNADLKSIAVSTINLNLKNMMIDSLTDYSRSVLCRSTIGCFDRSDQL